MTEYIPNIQTRYPKWIFGWFILAADLAAGWIAFSLTLAGPLAEQNIALLPWFLGLEGAWIIAFLMANLYRGEFTTSRVMEFETIIKLSFVLISIFILGQALAFWSLPFTPQTVFQYWIWFCMIALSLRMILRTIQKSLLKRGIGREKSAIIGLNHRGIQAASILEHQTQRGYDLIGYIRASDDPGIEPDQPLPVLGTEENLQQVINQYQISDIVLALDKPEPERLMNVIAGINGSPVTVKIVPGLYDVISGLARTEQIVGLPLLQINVNLESWYIKGFKRILDLVLVVPLFILSLPLWGFIAAAIKWSSPGPVFYRQIRMGKGGTTFTINKFRSMVVDAEKQTGPVWSGEDDPRITAVGRFLRRFRLDELPQLWNVIHGDMSLVGPRPERPYFVEKLMNEFPFYARRLRVRPGITGWAQIKHPYDRDITDVRQKLKYDFYYIENLSFNLDLKIILSTVWVMITGKGR
ncbi:MAG: sugar transferase [FCB group bacterium]|nr:sugar transferase [FCB group bacterium]